MPSPALSHIKIADPGWVGLRTIEVAHIVASFAVNDAGRFSCFVPAKSGGKAPDGNDYLGKWIIARFPCGIWGGTIEDAPVDLQRGTVELSCIGFGGMLQRVRTARTGVTQIGQAGALVSRAMRDGQSDFFLPFGSVQCDETGTNYQLQWRGDLVSTVISDMQRQSAQEWCVTVNDDRSIAFEWRWQCGQDLRASVLYSDAYHILGGRADRSLSGVVNDFLAVGNETDYKKAASVAVLDAASINLYGRRQGAAVKIVGANAPSTLEPHARWMLAQLSSARQPVTIPVRPDDRNAITVRPGDTTRLISSIAGKTWDFRIKALSLDVDSGILTLAGDASDA